MPTSPLMEFLHDPSWPAGTPTIFLTPTRVWGPLIAGAVLIAETVIMVLAMLIL